MRRTRAVGGASTGAALLAVVAVLASAPAASGQDPPLINAVEDWASAQRLRELLPGSQDVGAGTKEPSKSKQRSKRPTARQLATLRFQRTEQVTQDVYQALMERLDTGGLDPAQVAAELDRLKAIAHEGMRRVGWSPNNIGDVAAYTVVSCYAAYYGHTRLSDRATGAVRRDARDALASTAQVRRLSDARMQAVAEMLELRTAFRFSDLNTARSAGDAAGVSAARAEIRSWTNETFAVDVAKVRLTRTGLVRR